MFNFRGIQEILPRPNKKFVEKGCSESTVRKQIERDDHLDRSLFLKHYKPKHKDTIPFSLTYNPVLPYIKKIINKLAHIEHRQ